MKNKYLALVLAFLFSLSANAATISSLAAASTLTGTEPAAVDQAGATVKATMAQIKTYVNTVPLYLGTACNSTLYPASLLCVSNAPTSDVENHNIGIVGGGLATYAASGTPLTGWGIGVYGKGWTNGTTRSSGVTGEGMVTTTGDVGSAIGIRGYSLQTHAGGSNIGVLGDASGGATNYDFYSVNGKIISATGLLTNTGDLATTGKLTVGSGATGLVAMPWTGGSYGALYSTNVTPAGNNPALLSNGAITFLNGTTNARMAVGTVTIVDAVATGAAVTGTLSSTGVLSVPAGTSVANAIQFGGSATTGFYSTGAGIISTGATFVSAALQTVSINFQGTIVAGAATVVSRTAPVISSGFGTTPTITAPSTAAFKVTVGTGGAASGVLTFPAATTGWAVQCTDKTNTAGIVAVAYSTSTTSVTVEAYSRTTGLASTFAAGDVLEFSALGY